MLHEGDVAALGAQRTAGGVGQPAVEVRGLAGEDRGACRAAQGVGHEGVLVRRSIMRQDGPSRRIEPIRSIDTSSMTTTTMLGRVDRPASRAAPSTASRAAAAPSPGAPSPARASFLLAVPTLGPLPRVRPGGSGWRCAASPPQGPGTLAPRRSAARGVALPGPDGRADDARPHPQGHDGAQQRDEEAAGTSRRSQGREPGSIVPRDRFALREHRSAGPVRSRVPLLRPAADRRRRHAVPAGDHRGRLDVRGERPDVPPGRARGDPAADRRGDARHRPLPAAGPPGPAAADHRRPRGLGQRPLRRARPAQERQHLRRRRAADVPGHRHRDRDGQEVRGRADRRRRRRGDQPRACTTPTPGSTCATPSSRR